MLAAHPPLPASPLVDGLPTLTSSCFVCVRARSSALINDVAELLWEVSQASVIIQPPFSHRPATIQPPSSHHPATT